MKLTLLLIIIVTLLQVAFSQKQKEYETPIIVRGNGIKFANKRIDTLNDSSAQKYQDYLQGKLKNRLRNDMIREFNLDSYLAYINLLEKEEKEDLSKVPLNEVVESVGTIISKTADFQNYITFKANLIMKKAALLELKSKQIYALNNVLEHMETREVSFNSADSEYSNLLGVVNEQRLIETLAASNSEYDFAFHSLCEVLKVGERDLVNMTEEISQKNLLKDTLVETKNKINKHGPMTRLHKKFNKFPYGISMLEKRSRRRRSRSYKET